VERLEGPDQLQKLRFALNNFQKDIMKFSIMVPEIPGLVDYFRV
jgi:hypothetical protein